MVTAPRSETCSYCNTPVEDERAYRRHLHEAHDPSELGTIDRRRYDRYRPEPNVVVRAAGVAAARLDRLRYPVEGATMARYAAYGFCATLVVAALLGVST